MLLCAALAALNLPAVNPYLPLWEHVPDGEPYVFEDPDNPGKMRVYVYGSHDMLKTMYCGIDQIVWSAPVDSLDRWRYDGIIFEVAENPQGQKLNPGGRPDVLFAPDVAVRTMPDGKKEYYLYPNNQGGGRNGMVAKSDRPDGPFKVTNWSKKNPLETDGVLGFDPAVFVDDDGRVYGYWGFGQSHAAELDPATMATVKPGTKIVTDIVGSVDDDSRPGHFFEASSIRKIKDKYVFIYSRKTAEGEFGLPRTNYTLAYAYSDNPLGPFTYGGTIIDGRGRDTDADGNAIPTATPNGNTHGSICEINGKWWVFYHRQTGTDEYARQAMVAPVTVEVEEGKGGKVCISEAEYTSEGFDTEGLDPLRRYPAAIASHFTGPRLAYQEYPVLHYTGPYFQPTYVEDHSIADPYANDINMNPVVNCTDGSVLGYKYFNFSQLDGTRNVSLNIDLIPEGIEGTIKVYTVAPWKPFTDRSGTKVNPAPVGSYRLKADATKTPTMIQIPLEGVSDLKGRHPLYLTFSSPVKDKSLCTVLYLQFAKK